MKQWPPDDGKRELSDEEIADRFNRVSGDCVCEICGKEYRKHPMETRVLTTVYGEPQPFLFRLCNGWLGKL